MRHGKLISGGVILLAVAALGFQAASRAARPRIPAAMSALVPQGALLTIESPDFAGLLHAWNASPQLKAWLASDNYSVFSNSRLLGRLSDAQQEFESVAEVKARAQLKAANAEKDDTRSSGSTFGSDFLTQIAGRQSIFAWYDVGNLEFLYVTHMSAAQAQRVELLRSHAGWSQRQAGGSTFYVRHSSQGGAGQPRTVAFAVIPGGADTLVFLATREDLLAGALTLAHAPGASVAGEPWYADASAALAPPAAPPALHMILNLDRLVSLPAFHTYWVQRNITQMKQYRAAVSDLFLEEADFREERALLLKALPTKIESGDLAALTALAPPNSGVFRAIATHDPELAVTALEEKLLGGATLEKLPSSAAPDPSLIVQQAGSAGDLETRIDTRAPVSVSSSNEDLRRLLQSTGFDALLTYATALPPPDAGGLWVPIHSGVVLESTAPWNVQGLQAAVQQMLRGNLTTAKVGIEFRPIAGSAIYALSGPKALFLATRDNLAFLSDDEALLRAMLAAKQPAGAPLQSATQIAGFDHGSQRAPFARITSLIDGTNVPAKPATSGPANEDDAVSTPTFFSSNMRSLSDAFANLLSESFVEFRVELPSGPALHQTVTYRWNAR